MYIDASGCGLIGMVTNNTFYSGVIHRGMRAALESSFSRIAVLNLHGSQKIETAGVPDDDENVFDIMQAWDYPAREGRPRESARRVRGRRGVSTGEVCPPRIIHDWTLETVRVVTEAPLRLWTNPVPPGEYGTFISLRDLFAFVSVSGKPGDDGFSSPSTRTPSSPPQVVPRHGGRGSRDEAGRNLLALSRSPSLSPERVERYAYGHLTTDGPTTTRGYGRER